MNAEELKSLKEELKREILEEMNQKTFQKSAWVLNDVRKKYISQEIGLIAKVCGVPENYKIWDTIRKLTTLIMGKNRIDELEENEVEQAKQIATDLCEYAIKVHRERKSKSC